MAVAQGPGRPPKYCRRSHRQRAYESRQIASDRGLADDELLLSISSWQQLRDAIYVAEAAAGDAENDLVDAAHPDELVSIITSLRAVIAEVVDAVGEPKAVGHAL